MRKVLATLTAVMLVSLMASPSWAADWGNLKGKFLFDGTPPTPVPIKVTKDQPVCGNHKLVDESLVVNSDNNGLKNVIIYLYPGRRDKVAIHDSYKASEDSEVKLNNNNCRFDPHVSLLWTKQTLVLGNSDPVGHNTKIDMFSNPPTNYTIPSGGSVKQNFKKEEKLPAQVSCSIHPWMRGWLVVRNNPYMAVTDDDGNFEIKNIPTGKWEFMVWQEKASYLKEVTAGGKTKKLKRGRWAITIKKGDNDLGDVKVSASLFAK